MNLKNKRAHKFAAVFIGCWILAAAVLFGISHLIVFLLSNYSQDVVVFVVIGAVAVFLYWFMYFVECKS